MILKYNTKKQFNTHFIYSFSYKNKRFLIIYNKVFFKKHIILIPVQLASLAFLNNYILFIILNKIVIKEINIFIKIFFKNIIFNKPFFSKKILIIGLGFKIEKVTSCFLKIHVNFSHPFFIYVPKNINLINVENQGLLFSSNAKSSLSSFSSIFYQIKKPSLYKSKGLYFYDLLKTN